MSIMFYLEIGLMALLLAGLVYMHVINKKLKLLKSGGDGFKAVVIELSHATDNAQMAIQGLKLTVRDAEHGLDGNLKEARSISEELKYLLEQAKIYGDGIGSNNHRNLPEMSDNVRNTPADLVPQNKAKNFADQTLEKVARRKQSLPNPIVHSAGDRYSRQSHAAEPAPELGINLEPAHKEMALESRDLMLKSIANKKAQANDRDMQPQSGASLRQPKPGSNLSNIARNVPKPRPRPANAELLTGQPFSGQPMTGQPMSPQPTDQTQQSSSGMSLSDMVGRHAALEKQTFTKVDDRTDRRDNVAGQARGLGKSEGQTKSLFQRLSETR